MELWTEVRRRVLTGELGKRAACQEYKLHWQTLEKILNHTEPPGYRRTKARPRPKMERFLPVIVEILEADRRAPRKQRHTAKRIFDRLQAALWLRYATPDCRCVLTDQSLHHPPKLLPSRSSR